MKITQVFNNNVVLVCADKGEMVVLGTGIGFRKKAGDEIDTSLIKKKFILEKTQHFNDIASFFEMLDQEELEIIFEIVNDVKQRLDLKISDSIYPALADHIHYVIQRARSNMSLKCPLSNEVRYLYPQEYKVCLDYVVWLNQKFDVHLKEDEACSIVLHLFNAERDDVTFDQTVKETKIMKDIVDIVRLNYGMEFDEHSFVYHRFILHLQYFAKRILHQETFESNDISLVELVKTNYQKAFNCVEKIADYLMDTYSYKISNDEFVYLTIHIKKITEK